MDKRIRSYLGEKGACLPNFLKFILYTFFSAPSRPLPQSIMSIRYPITLNQMENVVWRWKAREIPEQYSNKNKETSPPLDHWMLHVQKKSNKTEGYNSGSVLWINLNGKSNQCFVTEDFHLRVWNMTDSVKMQPKFC